MKLSFAALFSFLLAGCGDSSSSSNAGGQGGSSTSDSGGGGNPSSGGSSSGGSNSSGGGGAASCGEDVDAPFEELGGGADPENNDFTLDEALAELPEGTGPLRAIFDTDFGTITCELFPEVAPIGVANFVGLARGRRAFLHPETDVWTRGVRYYDGLTFHRVVDDFVAQGGDPLGNGFGGPGYEFVNETANNKSHVPGTLSYANAGPDTNGSQFFMVAEVEASFLDGGYTIFGLCSEIDVIKTITEVPATNEEPNAPIIIHSVTITRC
jgi:peptidyl-prolyl cis-trans isomerase A (cyclophilin A)